MNHLVDSLKATRLACITDIRFYDHLVSFDNCINGLLLLLLLLESGVRIQHRFYLVDTTCNVLLLMLGSVRDSLVPCVRSQQEGLVGDYTDWLGLQLVVSLGDHGRTCLVELVAADLEEVALRLPAFALGFLMRLRAADCRSCLGTAPVCIVGNCGDGSVLGLLILHLALGFLEMFTASHCVSNLDVLRRKL